MTESEVPTLGLGAEQRQMWTQAVMTMAYGVRERRHALGQVAWSDEQTAERTHERTERDRRSRGARDVGRRVDRGRRPAPARAGRRAAHPQRRRLGDGVDRPTRRRSHRAVGQRRPPGFDHPDRDGRGRAAPTPPPRWSSPTTCSPAARTRSTGCTPSPRCPRGGPRRRPTTWPSPNRHGWRAPRRRCGRCGPGRGTPRWPRPSWPAPRSRRWRGGCTNSPNAATRSPMSSAASTPTG